MTTRNLAGQPSQTLVWDEGRRLSQVREGSTVVEEYLYSIDDTRVRTKAGDQYDFYAADGTQYSFDASTDTGYFTYYHQINGRTVAFTNGDTSETTWMGSDIVNSTAVTRDETGSVSTQRYTPFGELRNNANLDTDRLYTGQVFDEATGLAFYNARYYDPAIGRFASPDSIVPNPNDGQDYNRYSYVRNNPIKWSDPTGNVPCEYCNDRQRDDFKEKERQYQIDRASTSSIAAVQPRREHTQYFPPQRPPTTDYSALADNASDVALAADVISLAATGATASGCLGCVVAVPLAEGTGLAASAVEVYAGFRAGEAEHIASGGLSFITFGTSKSLQAAYRAQGTPLEGFEPLLIDGPAVAVNTAGGLVTSTVGHIRELDPPWGRSTPTKSVRGPALK